MYPFWRELGYIKTNKSINKSIRITPKVFEYIDGYQGNGVNEKLENIILYSLESEKEIKERLQYYTDLVESEHDKYLEIRKTIQSLDKFLNLALHMNSRLKELDEIMEEIIGEK